jgi:hypothetical protein
MIKSSRTVDAASPQMIRAPASESIGLDSTGSSDFAVEKLIFIRLRAIRQA